MAHFNIKVDRPKLSIEQIENKQNFDDVLSKYKSSTIPVYKKPWFWGSAGLASIGIATIVSLNIINSQVEKPSLAKSDSFLPPDTECIKPPVKGENIPFKTVQVNPNKEEKIVLESGTTITIPKNSLEAPNKDEKVAINIREFRDKSSAFIAGIPMDYQKDQAFESAGMIEIRGTQAGNEVKINEEKPIKVDLSCTQNPESFDFWKLNEKNSSWESYPAILPTVRKQTQSSFAETNIVEVKSEIKEIAKKIEIVETKISRLEKPTKEEYKLPDDSHQRFDLAFDKKEYPELAKFESLVFEVVPMNGYDKSFTQKNWSDVSLLKEKNKYLMKFESSKEQDFTIEVRPVVEGKDLNKAEKQFDIAISEYSDTKKKLEIEKNIFLRQQKENEERLAKLIQTEFEKQNAQLSSEDRLKQEKDAKNLVSYNATLSFETVRWGVFNCDTPINYPKASEQEITFFWKGQSEVKFKQLIVFNLEKNCRYVYGTYMQPISNFGVHKKDNLVIIGIDYDGNLGYKELKNRTGHEILSLLEFQRKDKAESSLALLKKLLNETTEVS